MKRMVLATVLTLVMLSPGMAADVRDWPASLLVASEEPDKGRRPVLIIKGEGGKVTGVEKGGPGAREEAPGMDAGGRDKRRKDRK